MFYSVGLTLTRVIRKQLHDFVVLFPHRLNQKSRQKNFLVCMPVLRFAVLNTNKLVSRNTVFDNCFSKYHNPLPHCYSILNGELRLCRGANFYWFQQEIFHGVAKASLVNPKAIFANNELNLGDVDVSYNNFFKMV